MNIWKTLKKMKMKNKENNEKEDDTNNPNLSNMTKDSNLKNVIETKEEIKKNTSGASFTYFFDFKPCKNFKLNLHGNNPYKTNYDQIKFFSMIKLRKRSLMTIQINSIFKQKAKMIDLITKTL